MDDSHLVVAALRNDLAVTAKHLGRPAEGEVLLRQALRAIETSVSPEHPAVATVLHNVGGATFACGVPAAPKPPPGAPSPFAPPPSALTTDAAFGKDLVLTLSPVCAIGWP